MDWVYKHREIQMNRLPFGKKKSLTDISYSLCFRNNTILTFINTVIYIADEDLKIMLEKGPLSSPFSK